MATLQCADVLVIVTEWKMIRAQDFAEIKAKLKHPLIFDGRNMNEPKEVRAAGIEYWGMGRGSERGF